MGKASRTQGHIDDYPEGPVLGTHCTGDPDKERAMGDTGTDHTKPENIHRIAELPVYRTDNHDEVIVQEGADRWVLYRRVATLGTRREAAELAADPTRRVTLA